MRIALLPLTALVALSLLVPSAPAQRRRSVDIDEVKLAAFSAKEQKFASEAIGEDVSYLVYLPKDYDAEAQKDTKWPLIVWLHGMWEDHLRFHGRGGAPMIDAAIAKGQLPACVFVCPNGGRTSMYVNRSEKKYEDLVTKDLLAHLQATYRISDRRDQRAIMGVSMGGMAALRIAFTQPMLFGTVAVHSSAVLPEDPDKLPKRMKDMAKQLGLTEVFGDPIEKAPWQQANPLCLARACKPADLHGLSIYFDAGTADRYGFAQGNEALHAALEQKGIEHSWRLIEGGGHSWGDNYQADSLPHSFACVGAMFAAAASKQSGLQGLGGEQDGKGGDKGKSSGGH